MRVCLDGGPSIDATLARIEGAGGRIAQPKSALSEGLEFMAHLLDTEGKEIGLHAPAWSSRSCAAPIACSRSFS
ncbi:MAG TPA: hypothetical protein VMR43_08085 [Variovorax sp.]|nr:hypothetical protein [Variovorax sp.]